MANLIKRKRQWVARISIYDGIKQHFKAIPLRTESKIEARVRFKEVERLESDIKNGIYYDFAWLKKDGGSTSVIRLSISDAIDEWLQVRKAIIKKNHYVRNVISMQRFLDSTNKNSPIEIYTSKDIEKFKVFYSNRHTPSGININLRAVKTFLKWCYERNYINKPIHFKMMRVPKQTPRYINEKQWGLIMESNIDEHWKRAFYVYKTTGCRKKEIFDGVIDGNWLNVKAEDSKTNIEKVININEEQKNIILEMKNKLNLFIKRGFNRKSFIDRYNKIFVNCLKNLNIYETGLSLHSLRHTYAVTRYLKTRDIYQVKVELGHTSVITTEKYATINLNKLEQDFPSLIKPNKKQYKNRKNDDMYTKYMYTKDIQSASYRREIN